MYLQCFSAQLSPERGKKKKDIQGSERIIFDRNMLITTKLTSQTACDLTFCSAAQLVAVLQTSCASTRFLSERQRQEEFCVRELLQVAALDAADLQRLERVRVSVAVQDDVVGHAEALPDAQVIEERELAESIGHLHHGDICRGERDAGSPAVLEGRRAASGPLLATLALAALNLQL